MRIAILGAGFAGLAAAFELTKKGFDVTIFEKEAYPGGLASGFQQSNWEWPLERAYHHLFTSDWHARNLLAEIGMGDTLFFERPITASLYTTSKLDARNWKLDMEARSSKVENPSSNFQPQNRASTLNRLPSKIGIFQLDSPLSLLHFPRLSPMDRMRAGAVLAYLKITPYWKDFEKTTAKEWLTHMMGKNVWKVLWEPLLVGKFGSYANTVNMAWFWARIKKRSPSLGYIEGGFQSFAEGIDRKVQENGGKIFYETEIEKIQHQSGKWLVRIKNQESRIKKNNSEFLILNSKFNSVLSTLPTPIFTHITPQLPKDYVDRLQSIPHLHALNLILELKEPFLPPLNQRLAPSAQRLGKIQKEENQKLDARRYFLGAGSRPYWLNICDPSWPFLAVVEHTNFIDSKHYGGSHIVYIGNYLPREHEYFKKSKEELLQVFKPFLAKINPEILNSKFPARNATHSVAGGLILNSHKFVGPFAQPVVGLNYSQIRPSIITPLPNLYMANLDSVYPWDRGTNYAIELGQNAAKKIMIQCR